jgi:hypothetical protein
MCSAGRSCGRRRSLPSARTSPARSSSPLVEVEARVALREGAESPVMDAPWGKKMCSGLGARTSVSSTVKPLDGGASTHPWACAPPRALAAELSSQGRRYLVLASSVADALIWCSAVRERNGRGWNVARVPWCEPTEGFCSPGFDAEPSDRNEQSMMFGPSLGPSGRETLPA